MIELPIQPAKRFGLQDGYEIQSATEAAVLLDRDGYRDGGNDAAASPTYGTAGLAMDIDDVRSHGKDERVPVKSFYEGQEYLYRLVKLLAIEK